MFNKGRLLAATLVMVLLAPMMTGQSARGREILVTTVEELALIASGRWTPMNTPHAGGTLSSGDVIVLLAPGIYDIGSRSINVTLSGLVIKSSDGAEATVIRSTSTAFTIKGEDITVQGLTISGGEVGIEIIDAKRAKILENRVDNAGIGVKVARADDVRIESNEIVSNDVGIELEASTNVWVLRNDIRNNKVGIKVLRNSCSVRIHENNIARNEIGIDASESSCTVYACDNWWGEPSSPVEPLDDIMPPLPPAPPPPGQIKGPVETRFCPPWPPPPLPCIAIESLTADKTDMPAGETVTFTIKIKNRCSETITSQLLITMKDGLGNIVNQFSRQFTINTQSSREEIFSFIFAGAGQYTLTVEVGSSTQSLQVLVECLIPHVFDRNRNDKLDDSEIIEAIDIWVRGVNIPGCGSPSQKLSDADIIRMIDLWIRQQSLNSL
jgi:parallel beta-helix repeat protein